MVIDNLKFSCYDFLNEELVQENKVDTYYLTPSFNRYIISLNDISSDNEEKIFIIYDILKKLKENVNFSEIDFTLIYSVYEIIDIKFYNPIIIVDRDTWILLKGILIGQNISDMEE